ncbi:glycosyltransferase [Natrinema sp. LN54]|uniref:glycosyltransferase n=1 Tax=Natrinema sp. LN54 TaxID=3458705 RepID=UPI0040373622
MLLRSMNIVFVSHLFPTPENSMKGVFVLRQARALSERGHQVTVISPIPYVPRTVSRLLGRPTSADIPRRDTYDDISVYYPRYWSLPGAKTLPIITYSFRRSLHEYRELFEAADIINAHVALPDGFASISLARQFEIPLVTTIHGADIYKSAKNPICQRQIQTTFDESDDIIMNSNMLLDEAKQHFSNLDCVHVVYNGTTVKEIDSVEPQDLSDTFSDGRMIVTTVGTLIERKGHKTVIEALRKIPETDRPYYLVIGDGPLRDELRSYVRDINLEDYVQFTGYIPDHDSVFAKLKSTDVMAMPSIDEAFGVAYLEGMACGLPVIACEGEGPSDFITDRETGFLVPPHDSDKLSDVLRELHRNPELRQRVGNRGQRTAFNAFSWERNAKSVEGIFKNAVESR